MPKVVFEVDAKDAGALQAFIALENKQEAVEKKSAKLAQTSSRGAQRSTRANKGWFDSLGRVVLGYIGITKAVQGVTSAIEAMHAERKRGAEGAREAGDSIGALLQLSGGRPGEYKRMMAEAGKSARRYGLMPQEATGLQFTLESGGFAEQRELFATFAGVADPNALAAAARTHRGAFGKKEAGSYRQIVNKFMAGAKAAQATIPEYAAAATVFGQIANLSGVTDEEGLAALAHLSFATDSPLKAGTQISSFLTATNDKGIGGGIMERAAAIKAMNLTPAGLKNLLGRKEAVTGFGALSGGQAEVAAIRKDIEAAGRRGGRWGGRGDLVDAMEIERATTTPVRQLFFARRAKGRKAWTELMKFGPEQLLRDEAIENLQTESMEMDEGAFRRWLLRKSAGLADKTGASGQDIRRGADSMRELLDNPWQLMNANTRRPVHDPQQGPVDVRIREDETRSSAPDRNAGTP